MAVIFQSPAAGLLSRYDIVAVQPSNEKLFHLCCKELDVDLICFEMTKRLEFALKHSSVGLAVERGIYFEIAVADGLAGTLGCEASLWRRLWL